MHVMNFFSCSCRSKLTVHFETQTWRYLASLITLKKHQTLFKIAFGAVMKHKNRQKNLASGKL